MTIGMIDDSTLYDIGDAIREKNGSTIEYLPSEMSNAIRSISGGKADFVVRDTPPEDKSVLWVDTSDNSNGQSTNTTSDKGITRYLKPAEVPLENGAQYIFYAAEGCTITIEIGTFEAWNGSNKAEFQLASRTSVLWFLWTQTDIDGSLIPTHGDRGYFQFEGDCSKMKISATTSENYVVLKIG